MKKLLLCPPNYYNIEYEINPWMHISNKVNKEIAQRQFEELKTAYKRLNVDFMEIKPLPSYPDMVYTANFGHAENNLFITANFLYPQRRGESQAAMYYFRNLGYDIYTLPENVYFEGQGDLLKRDDRYFFGWGKRSSKEAKDHLSKALQKEIIDLELIDPYYYHLDTCFSPVSKTLAMINPRSFTKESLEKIYTYFETVIETSVEDNKILACNLVVIDKNVIIPKGISEALRHKLEEHGYTIHEVEMTEYLKGGGSVKCASLEIY